jgi:hypothetical protein
MDSLFGTIFGPLAYHCELSRDFYVFLVLYVLSLLRAIDAGDHSDGSGAEQHPLTVNLSLRKSNTPDPVTINNLFYLYSY